MLSTGKETGNHTGLNNISKSHFLEGWKKYINNQKLKEFICNENDILYRTKVRKTGVIFPGRGSHNDYL